MTEQFTSVTISPPVIPVTEEMKEEEEEETAEEGGIKLNIELPGGRTSLEDRFISEQVRSASMQLVLWSPPILTAFYGGNQQDISYSTSSDNQQDFGMSSGGVDHNGFQVSKHHEESMMEDFPNL